MDSKPYSKQYSHFAAFEMVDFSGLGTSDLIKQILQADAARRELEGHLTAMLGRLGELEGDDAVHAVCDQFGIRGHRSRRQAKVATGLRAMPDVLQAARDGWITMDHAGLMADSHARAPISVEEQHELVVLAIKQDCDEFKKTLAAREDQRQAGDGLSRTERQRSRRSAKLFDGDNEMVILHAELDRISGERVKAALDDMSTRMLKQDSGGDQERSWEQRNADALVALITQQPATSRTPKPDSAEAEGAGEADNEVGCEDIVPQKTVLIVSADYDAITGELQNAGLIDGTPIELDELRHLACDAEIIPMIFNTKGQPLYVGRRQRTATKAQKLALYKRDQGCVGCGLRPTVCDAHHILPWEEGGPTDVNNLVLLCPRCHRKVHRDGHTVEKHPRAGKHHLNAHPRIRPPNHEHPAAA